MTTFCNLQNQMSRSHDRDVDGQPENCVVPLVYATSPVSKLQFPLEQTKGYMSGLSTLSPPLLLQ